MTEIEELFSAIRNDSHLRHYKIDLEQRNGSVRLSGSVGCYYHKQIAQELVRTKINGHGYQIENDLVVESK